MNPEYTEVGDFLEDKEDSALAHFFAGILSQIPNEDPQRNGLLKTPKRAASAMQFMTQGYEQDPVQLLTEAIFEEKEFRDMVIVKDIEFYSLCLPSRQLVDAVGGQKHASDIQIGTELYTLHRGQRATTRVVSRLSRKAEELVELTPHHSDGTPGATIRLTPEHPVMTPEGWREAGELRSGGHVEYAPSQENSFVELAEVRRRTAVDREPFTVYSFQCEPYPTFCVDGILTHNCEHHLLPFYGHCHVAYIPTGRIIGLSKIPRLVEVYARRLQVQERLTRQIGQIMNEVLQPRGVAVVMEARHLCMMIRGVEKQHSKTVTSALFGEFHEDRATRAELMNLLRIRST